MRIFREIFGRVWALWVLLLFVVTMIPFLLPALAFCATAPEPARTRRFIKYARVWMAIYLRLIGCPLRISGKENFAPGEQYIVICNHNALMDVPVSSPSIPGANKTIAKAEMAKIPVFGMIYKMGSVLVDRKSDKSRKESYLNMKKVLDMGMHMCIYPEGTRNKTEQPLKAFHDGAFRLALDTRKSIIPGMIFNTRKVNPADKFFYIMPHRLYMDFLPPIAVEPGDTVESLRNRSFEIMKDYYSKNA
ncbi:lysophospholipid acyltransferase family protein [Flavihumibacter solisilvae]|uniref:Glycerol acyltransferase n=1 Tax=Flavihumibacter solisilvae TaxID=1349421 RepID=A0A0C1IWI1_9BACT|nr:lysophospholipid acyltransferase family protein [Flavihumibacter solisilvae]KIC94859.1 glycerol acyltransferase [Flavihumibacter solisilvae]